jgi:hypothetical protein
MLNNKVFEPYSKLSTVFLTYHVGSLRYNEIRKTELSDNRLTVTLQLYFKRPQKANCKKIML